jgi:hypothetical protein
MLYFILRTEISVTHGAGLKPCQNHFYCVQGLISKDLCTKLDGVQFRARGDEVHRHYGYGVKKAYF